MNKITLLLCLPLLFSAATLQAQTKKKSTAAATAAAPAKKAPVAAKALLATHQDSVYYAIGVSMAKSLQQFNIKSVDVNVLSQAIGDVLSEKAENMKMSEGEAMQLMQSYFMELKNAEGNVELKKGADFLAENKKQPGVVELPSGLQYKIIVPGNTSLKPKETDTVEVHYRGTLLDGKEFDSSYKRNKTVKFPLNQVIKGWTEGVQLIGKGGKIMLFIPSKLAYGERGAGRDIPANATLIFEVELIDVAPSN